MLASACTASTSGYSARGLTHASSARAVGVKRCRRQQRLALQVASGRRRKHYEDYEEAEPELQAEEYTQEPQYQQGIDPTPPPAAQERRGVPLFITIPGALLVVFAVFRILKKLQSRGFVSQLDELLHKFMFLNSSCWRPCYVDIMKHVNTMAMEELSEDQIAAARARRSKERDMPRVDIDKLELPDNHPFAVKKKISKDEEELARKRMEVKRGLPLQDLSGKRGFPDDPRQAANEKMQAEAQKLDEKAARAREARFARQAAAHRQQQQQQQQQQK